MVIFVIFHGYLKYPDGIMFCWRKTQKNLENLRVVEDWIELSSPVKNEKVLNATGVQPSWGWGQGVSNWIGKMETRTKDRGLKISVSSLRISWKPMYSSDFKHGMAISLAIDAGCSLAGFQLRISAVPCQRYKIPDISPRWCVLGDSYDQQHLLLGSIASNQGEIWRDFDEPIFKICQNVLKIIQLKYIMTYYDYIQIRWVQDQNPFLCTLVSTCLGHFLRVFEPLGPEPEW